MVRARSGAGMPVVAPGRRSTDTVNAVPCRPEFADTICGRSSSAHRPNGRAAHTPAVCRSMYVMAR